MYFLRRYQGAVFHLAHTILAIASLIGLIWHSFLLHSTTAIALLLSATGIWTLTAIYRLMTIIYRGRHARIIGLTQYSDATVVDVKVKHPLRLFPGAYFYISLPGSLWRYEFWTSYPMMAVSHDPSQRHSRGLSFFMSHQGRHASHLERLEDSPYLLLEGPYGQDLQLDVIENISLVAKGVGILGVLPIALYLAARRQNDDTVMQLLQGLPQHETQLRRAEQSWQEKKNLLSVDEKNLELEQKRLQDGRIIGGRAEKSKLERWIREETRSLGKQRIRV